MGVLCDLKSQDVILASLSLSLSVSQVGGPVLTAAEYMSHRACMWLGHSEACVSVVIHEMTLNPFRSSLG